MSKLAKLFSGESFSEIVSSATGDNPNQPAHFTLLFVDDESSVLSALKRIFFDENYRIITAQNPLDALDIIAQEPVHLVISDFRMPEMDGADLLRKIKEENPDIIRIMLTGHADIQSVMGAISDGAVYKFITKPWNDEDLRLTVSLALQQYVLMQENKELKQITKEQKLELENVSSLLGENHAFLSSILEKSEMVNSADFTKSVKERLPNEHVVQALERLGLVEEKQVIKALQKQLNLEFIDLRELQVNQDIIGLLPAELCYKKGMVPIRFEKNQLTLAMADPSDIYYLDNLARMTGFKIKTLISSCSQIYQLLDKTYQQGREGEFDFRELAQLDPIEEIDIMLEDDISYSVKELLDSSEIPPIIRIVNAIISEAIRFQASDIHIEPKTKYTVIRFRIDGLLFDKIRIPAELHLAAVSRIKILSKLDISERRRPQDGRISVKSGTRMVDLRVSTMPSINGEKVVMRVLDKSSSVKPLEQLGFLPATMEKLTALIRKPQGIIISSGPTGSGKTTLLYSILGQMLDSSRNFETIEDPVEYFLEEANQVFVRDKEGLSFPAVLRATLRQDPDVILVGEVRDQETADIAFKAALTGHMVLTSLHTNSSIASITRLIDLGVKPYLISSSLEGIVAQRLVRKLCPHCCEKGPIDLRIKNLLRIPDDRFMEGVWISKGCKRCESTGYLGRIGLFELFVMNDDFRQLINESYKESALQAAAVAGGFTTLLQDGLDKVERGETSLEEILRILGPQIRHERLCSGCQTTISANFQFCPYCGTPKQKICHNCFEPMAADWSVCVSCGVKQ